MPNYRRARVAGGTYFFTVVARERRPVLTGEAVRTALREAIARVRATKPFRVDAWVLLPDHLHCLWTLPPGDADFSSRWSAIKRLTSQAAAGSAGTESAQSGLWQERFWEHVVRDDPDFARHADYIHWNPVRHGHAARAADWPYSTFRRYCELGVYPDDWGGGNARAASGAAFGE